VGYPTDMRLKAATILVGVVFLMLADPSAAWAKDRRPSLPFSDDLKTTLEAAKTSGKPVVLSFVAAWCPVCTQMKREAFRDPAVVGLADEFLWVRVDIDRRLTTAQEYGVEGVPLIYLLDSEGVIRVKLLGLQEPAALHDNLTRFVETLEQSPELQAVETPDTGGPRSALIWKPKGYRGVGVCFSHVGYGPLKMYSQSPFQSLRLGLRARTPSTLAKGQYEASARSTWVSVWGLDKTVGDPTNEFFLDFEMLQTSVALAYGISDTLEIEGEIQNRSRFGGALDGFTQGFHDLFGIDQNGRDEVPKGGFLIELDPPGGPSVTLDSDDRGSFSRTLQFSVQHNVTCGTARLPAFSYSLTARLETLDVDGPSSGSDIDLVASVAVSRRVGRFYLYGTLGYAWFGRDNFRGIVLKDTQFSSLLAFEWRFRARQSLLLQYLRTNGLIEDFGPFSDTSNEITVGYKWEVRQKGILELGFIENIGSFDNSPDFGIHAGFSQRF